MVTPADARSGVLKSDTVQRTAKVAAIDRKRRQATLEFPDGTSNTFAIRKDVDLEQVRPGEGVMIRTASAVALTPEKP